MDIEQIEKYLAVTLAALDKDSDVPSGTIYSTVQIQLLMHIYHKLEAIESQLTPQNPPRISYSQRVY